MNSYLLIFLGAGFGAMARQAVSVGCGRLCGEDFPWGILIVNVTGCLVMGLVTGWLACKMSVSPEVKTFVTTGFLGGYTTFSTFSLDVAMLWDRGAMMGAAFYVVASVALSILAVFAGLSLARTFS